MTKKSVPPAVDETAFECPHCGVLTTQHWHELRSVARTREAPRPVTSATVLEVADIEHKFNSETIPGMLAYRARVVSGEISVSGEQCLATQWNRVTNLHIAQCYNCDRFSVWVGTRLVDPPPRLSVQPNGDLPDDVRQDFNEASSIVSISPRGAAALLRLCVQKLCIHLGEKGNKIDDDIAALVRKGLNPLVQQALDIVRVIGNEAVHPGTMDLRDDPNAAHTLFGLVNAIADQMISHPKTTAELYAKLPQSKRDAITKRDGKQGPAPNHSP